MANLMVTIAWGENPPEDQFERLNWFSEYHVSLFCRIKDVLERAQGETKWASFREEKLRELPGAESLGRTKAWQMSLLSTNCDKVN